MGDSDINTNGFVNIRIDSEVVNLLHEKKNNGEISSVTWEVNRILRNELGLKKRMRKA